MLQIELAYIFPFVAVFVLLHKPNGKNMPRKLLRFESARVGSISRTHGDEHGYGYDDTAEIASLVDTTMPKRMQNVEHASNRQMKLDMARTRTRTMDNETRNAMRSFYRRREQYYNRKAQGLANG